MKKIITSCFVLLLSYFNMNAQSASDLKGIEVGSKAPLFSAIDHTGNEFSLKDALAEGPVVLVFYRGQWCPLCNKHLSSIQDSLAMLQETGARLIAVSPEKPEFAQKMAAKTNAEFQLLYDKNYEIGLSYDVIFQASDEMVEILKSKLNADLENAHSDNSKRIPIPATYIIGKDGTVIWRHFDPDYKKRSSVAEMVSVLSK